MTTTYTIQTQIADAAAVLHAAAYELESLQIAGANADEVARARFTLVLTRPTAARYLTQNTVQRIEVEATLAAHEASLHS